MHAILIGKMRVNHAENSKTRHNNHNPAFYLFPMKQGFGRVIIIIRNSYLLHRSES